MSRHRKQAAGIERRFETTSKVSSKSADNLTGIIATEGLATMFSARKVCCAIAILSAWMALLLSPVGHYVAGISIVILVFVLFVCGCIKVRTTSED